MTVSTPPRPASFSEPVPALGPGESGLEEPALIEALREQALIEEARRHQPRAQLCPGVSIVCRRPGRALAVRGSGDGSARAGLPSPLWRARLAVALKTSGQLTVIGIRRLGRQQPAAQADGWYGLSTVGWCGQLHYLVRCPDHAKWCGEVESLDWSATGGGWRCRRPRRRRQPIQRNPHRRTWQPVSTASSAPAFPPNATGRPAWSPDAARLAYVSEEKSTSSTATAPDTASSRRECWGAISSPVGRRHPYRLGWLQSHQPSSV